MDIKQQQNNNNNTKMFSNTPITKISTYQQNNLTTTDSILRAKIKYNKGGFLPNIYEHVTQQNNTTTSTAVMPLITTSTPTPTTASITTNINNANRNSMYFYSNPMSNPSTTQSDMAINANGHRKQSSNGKDVVIGNNCLVISHQDKQQQQQQQIKQIINEPSSRHHQTIIKTSDYGSNASSSASSSSSNEIEEEENLIEMLIRSHNTYQLNENFKKLIKPYSYYLNDSIFKSVVHTTSTSSSRTTTGFDNTDTNYDSDTSTESFSRYAPTDDEEDDKE